MFKFLDSYQFHFNAKYSLLIDSQPCISEYAGTMLTTGEPESLFGSGVSWSDINLAVAAERSSLGARLGGSIYVYKFEKSSSF